MKPIAIKKAAIAAFCARLRQARSGVAYIEFALVFPMVMASGLAGIEATNLSMTHMRISQLALSMADNSSRIGQDTALSQTQFREIDIVDSFAAAILQAGNRDIVDRGRIVLSSLERNASGGQWIHWQRCIGKLKENGSLIQSAYGVQGKGATGTSFAGMGPAGKEITAPASNAVMFVEIAYDYEPLISSVFFGKPRIKYTAAFIVRDKRNLTGDPAKTGKYGNVFNPTPAVPDSGIGFC